VLESTASAARHLADGGIVAPILAGDIGREPRGHYLVSLLAQAAAPEITTFTQWIEMECSRA
jgi:hypothetical protein